MEQYVPESPEFAPADDEVTETDDYDDGIPRTPDGVVSCLDLMCFEVDEEVFNKTKEMVEKGIELYGHMTQDEMEDFIKNLFKYSFFLIVGHQLEEIYI